MTNLEQRHQDTSLRSDGDHDRRSARSRCADLDDHDGRNPHSRRRRASRRRPGFTQQLRNATPSGAAPRFLIRDRDDKFGTAFDGLAGATGIRIVRTAVRAPNVNAVCERFLG